VAIDLKITMIELELELELILSHMTQKPMLRGEVIDCDYRTHDLLRIMVSMLLFGPKSVFDRNHFISDTYFGTSVGSYIKANTTSWL
jgi:hypothetical protein